MWNLQQWICSKNMQYNNIIISKKLQYNWGHQKEGFKTMGDLITLPGETYNNLALLTSCTFFLLIFNKFLLLPLVHRRQGYTKEKASMRLESVEKQS